MYLSPYQTAGFDRKVQPVSALHADMVRRPDSPKVIRFGGRADVNSHDIRKLPVCSSAPSRTMARLRASLTTPAARLFMSTSSSTFVFMLGFLS
jgi:hypothetical protein